MQSTGDAAVEASADIANGIRQSAVASALQFGAHLVPGSVMVLQSIALCHTALISDTSLTSRE